MRGWNWVIVVPSGAVSWITIVLCTDTVLSVSLPILAVPLLGLLYVCFDLNSGTHGLGVVLD